MKSSVDTTRQFQYLKTKNLGDKIRVLDNGDIVEVSLVRRGRQKVRVKDPAGKEKLVLLGDVLTEKDT